MVVVAVLLAVDEERPLGDEVFEEELDVVE